MAKGSARWEQDEMLAGLMDAPPTAAPRVPSGSPGKAAAKRPTVPQIALNWITADVIDLVSNVALMALIVAGVAISLFGTYYGMRSMSLPVADGHVDFGAVLADLKVAWPALFAALGAQALFSAFQLRFRLNAQRARAAGDPRWYRWGAAYAFALLVSLVFNVQAYWGPATGWWPPAVVMIGLLVVDMAPELMVDWKGI